ncbi:MAG: hypothetical protein NPINA01_03610 [Nitrospinaceae bacterium]|nr:MAG: hypothetical protein NPINA01_03610 [Nitrospinaceae bacterium]
MSSREIKTRSNGQKKEALETLWEDIEKAVLQSPAVRVSLTNYQAIGPMNESLQDKIILNIDKLTEMVKNDEVSPATVSGEEPSPEDVFRGMVRELRGHLIKSIQTNLNLIDSTTKLSIENEKLKKEFAQLSAKHKKALENIEKILMNITRNPN